MDDVLYRRLVPDAPPHRRTEGDPAGLEQLVARRESLRTAALRTPGLQAPRLISTFEGRIEQLLLAFPSWAVEDPPSAAGYRSVISALRPGTEFVVVHHDSHRAAVAQWFTDAGHSSVVYVPLPEYVSFTDWAEDGYVALVDAADQSQYLMEPWRFPRAGDALIADAVEEYTTITASQAPLIFQGGNCLIGDDFWFLGEDYFADSVALVQEQRPPVTVPAGSTPAAEVRGLFRDYVEAGRRLTVVGTRQPIPLGDYQGRREGDAYFLDLPSSGAGTYQPIFHIDMLITLVGRLSDRFTVLVGDPSLADELLGTTSPYGLADVYDQIAASLTHAGFDVRRNPLVHRPVQGQQLSLAELRSIAQSQGDTALTRAVQELAAAGAGDDTTVVVRDWYHATWNNCLVENSAEAGRHVYLPTFGHGPNADLAVIDQHMTRLWEELGFTVHQLADFSSFARRQGVVHCIKKYLRRGR